MTFSGQLKARLAELREQSDRVEVRLPNPEQSLLDAIAENGGVILRDGWHQLCHSGDTCRHNSHPAGENFTIVEVPASWQSKVELTDATPEVWCFDDDCEYPVMLIPCDPPLLCIGHQYGDGSLDRRTVGLRPQAASLLKTER